uniref:beta strand repeat-containing protein n=2 Tax=Gammaproteobacteria TaxID=1236 RepID=UPI00332B26D0
DSGATADISGTTTDVAPGSTVTLVLTDANGTQVTVTGVTINNDGSYSIAGVDVSTLVDGDITVSATALDNNGNSVNDTDVDNLDTTPATAPLIEFIGMGDEGIYSADEIGPDNSVTATVTLTTGTQIGDTLVVTDGSGNVLASVTVTQDMLDNGYPVEVPVTAGATDVNVTAQVTDMAGNPSAVATDTQPIDRVAPGTPSIIILDDGTPGDGWLNQGEINANGAGIQIQANADHTDLSAGGFVAISISIDGRPQTSFELKLVNGSLVNLDGSTPVVDFTYNNGVITWNQDTLAEGQTLTVEISQTDSAGNQSVNDNDAVTVNGVDATDDTPGTIYIASANSSNAWAIPEDTDGEPKFTISARNADGSIGDVNISNDNNKLGVSGSPRSSGQIAGQIEYDSATNTSEAIIFDFNGLVNQATFSVANLFGDESSGEQGVWKAYYNGELVAMATFTTGAGNTTGTFTINTGNLVFDQLVFEAIPTISEQNGGPALNDSSDYFLTSLDVSGPALTGTIITSESEILDVLDPADGLLANDIDAQGHDFILTSINGDSVTSGQVVTLDSGALLTIYADGTYSYNPNGAFNNLASGELTTDTFNYTITDEFGATDTATVTVNIVGTNDLVAISTPDILEVFESGLSNGSNINAAIETSGSMVIDIKDGLDRLSIQVDGNSSTLTLAALMAASLVSPIIIAGEFGELSITGYNDGLLEYTYNLVTAQNHTGSNGETITDTFQITAIDVDGDQATTTLNAVVHDDQPIAIDNSVTLSVTQDSFAIIGGVQAEWKTVTGGANVVRFDGDIGSGGEDNDSALDQVRWGVTNGAKSGYGFMDNDGALNGEVVLNQDIVLGTFTHYNYPINSGSSITAATMDVVFNVIDSFGNVTAVTLKLNFAHNETPNDGADPRDIVTIGQTNVTFNYEGEQYTIQVIGFEDGDGNVVSSIYTDENASTSYDLVIRMVAGSGYSLPSVEGNVLDNDITGADISSVIGVAIGDQTSTNTTGNVGVVITGQYGTVIINNDGTYTYELTSTTDTIPSGATDVFTYTIQDSDGDISSAVLEINVNLVNAQDVPVEDANNITTTGTSLGDEFIVLQGDNGLNQKQLNVTFGGGLFGQITDENGNTVTASGSNLTSYSSETTQVISSGSGSDHVETGRGGDIIYAGETGSYGLESDDDLELTTNTIANNHIMTGTLSGADSIIDTDGLLLSNDVASLKADIVNSGNGNDFIYGQSGSDILYGHNGNDYIDGGTHNDGLRGGAGNDTLIGGLGDDVLRGDSGADTFKWQLGEFGNDIISDFNHNEDKIDLSDLLINEEYNNLENLLNFSYDANGSSVIEIDTNGDGSYEQTITLDGVDLSSIYGSSQEGVIINGLLNDGALIVDTNTTTPNGQGIDPFVNNPDGQIIP